MELNIVNHGAKKDFIVNQKRGGIRSLKETHASRVNDKLSLESQHEIKIKM